MCPPTGNSSSPQQAIKKVRLDKWLWAARFFKTRAQAKKAITNGKILVNDARIKPAREIVIGVSINIKKSDEAWEVVVNQLSEQRRAAPIAQQLYSETPLSVQQRELRRLQHKSWHSSTNQRPSAKERRQAIRFRAQFRAQQNFKSDELS